MAQTLPVCPASEIPQGGRKIAKFGKFELGVFNVGGEFYAYRNICPHAGAPVCQGKISGTSLPSGVYEYNYGLDGGIIRCPWHGWEFDLKTGEHIVDPETRLKKVPVEIGAGPAPAACSGHFGKAPVEENLESFPVKQEDGILYVTIPGGSSPP